MKFFTHWFVFILLPFGCFAQSVITGNVRNKADGKPVSDASVFLSNTSMGTKTGDNGTFTLSNVRAGKYELIVSIIGFEIYSQPITVNNNRTTLGDILILPKQLVLNEVTVKAARITDVNRQKYLSWFKEYFLGTSNIALNCKILNPDVLSLHFDQEKNTLTASSSGFLLIENPDLGYKINYLLKHFSVNLSDRNAIAIQFEGSVLFENMADLPAKEQRWQKQRLNVYDNSSMHFLRAALSDKLSEDGFTVFPSDWVPNLERPPDSLINAKLIYFGDFKDSNKSYPDSLTFWEKKAELPERIKNSEVDQLSKNDIIKPTNQPGLYALVQRANSGGLRVCFNKYNKRFNNENTYLNFRKKYVLFDENGVFIDPDGLVITGSWIRNRVAELLPLDYNPSSTIKQ